MSPSSTTPRQARPLRPGSVRWTLGSLALVLLLSSLGTSIANVALPTLAQAFDSTFQTVQWVVLAYLLGVTTLIVSVGRLGDLFGRRRLMLAGIGLFTVASIACGLASALWMLIAARAAQGLGAAVMMALTMALVGDVVPQARAGRAMGLLATMSAAGTALGPSLGGVLVATLGWRSLFLINLPLGLVALLLAWATLPADAKPRQRPSFDWAGSALLALALAAYALSMTLGRGHFGALNGALLGLTLAAAAVFVAIESRTRTPLVRTCLFRNPALGAGFAMGIAAATVAMTTLVVGPFYLTGALHLDTAAVGLVMTSGPLAAALAGVPAGRAVDRWGAPRMTAAGLACMAGGSIALALVPPSLGSAGYMAPLVSVTAGFATFQAANNTAAVTGVAAGERGVAAALLNLARNIGLITGASLMGAVFAMAGGTKGIAAADAAAVAAGARTTFAVAAVLVLVALAVALCVAPRPAPVPGASGAPGDAR